MTNYCEALNQVDVIIHVTRALSVERSPRFIGTLSRSSLHMQDTYQNVAFVCCLKVGPRCFSSSPSLVSPSFSSQANMKFDDDQ